MYVFHCSSIHSCKLEVYSEENYGGNTFTIREQYSNFESMFRDVRDDFIPMSFKVKGTCQWLIYSDYNFQGMSYILEPGNHPATHTWGVGGNEVYSARVLPPKGSKAITLFRWPDFTGRMMTIYKSQPNLSMHFPGYFDSLIVTGGKWTLYTEANYSGEKLTYSGQQTVRQHEERTLFYDHPINSIKRNRK